MAEYIALCAKRQCQRWQAPFSRVHAYASGGAHAVGCRF